MKSVVLPIKKVVYGKYDFTLHYKILNLERRAVLLLIDNSDGL